MIWGDGFLSPGGPEEVARILGGLSVRGLRLLDIGSGAGGADVVLARDFGAAGVVGIDIDQGLVERAAARARALQLDDRLSYLRVQPGELPFPGASFDAVFSKDSILHVGDKAALYAEMFRVLRPGGHILIGDWLKGEEVRHDALLQEFVAASGHTFTMVSLRYIGELVSGLGFSEIELEDRRSWYLPVAASELGRLRGSLGLEMAERWGQEALQSEILFWEVLVKALEGGALRPGHVRARKPL